MRVSTVGGVDGKPLAKILEGRAIVFDKPTPIYRDDDGIQYYEQIHHDALKGVDLSNVVLKYNHSPHVPPLASTKAGTLDLTVDKDGLAVKARMANTTQASDMYELVRSGELDKMSFSFLVGNGNDVYDARTRTRTILRFEKIYDVAIVDFAAYDETSISARSLFGGYKGVKKRRTKEEQRQILILKTKL